MKHYVGDLDPSPSGTDWLQYWDAKLKEARAANDKLVVFRVPTHGLMPHLAMMERMDAAVEERTQFKPGRGVIVTKSGPYHKEGGILKEKKGLVWNVYLIGRAEERWFAEQNLKVVASRHDDIGVEVEGPRPRDDRFTAGMQVRINWPGSVWDKVRAVLLERKRVRYTRDTFEWTVSGVDVPILESALERLPDPMPWEPDYAVHLAARRIGETLIVKDRDKYLFSERIKIVIVERTQTSVAWRNVDSESGVLRVTTEEFERRFEVIETM